MKFHLLILQLFRGMEYFKEFFFFNLVCKIRSCTSLLAAFYILSHFCYNTIQYTIPFNCFPSKYIARQLCRYFPISRTAMVLSATGHYLEESLTVYYMLFYNHASKAIQNYQHHKEIKQYAKSWQIIL